jgi:hypothetical protein
MHIDVTDRRNALTPDQLTRVKDLSSKISSFTNGATRDEIRSVGLEMTLDHRTLVQNKSALIMEFIRQLANNYETKNYDLRNEASCKWAHDIVTTVGLPAMPFI